jgi:hypothetical protein
MRRFIVLLVLGLAVVASHACNIFDDTASSTLTACTQAAGAGGDFGAGGDYGAGGDVGNGVGGSSDIGTGVGVGTGAGVGGGDGNARRPPRQRRNRHWVTKATDDPMLMPQAAGDTFGFCTGLCTAQCPAVGQGITAGFAASVFKFVTIVKDDGQGLGGGWQQAIGTLSFFRWTTLVPESWTCTITVGMPIRAMNYGVITAAQAANMTAGIATTSSFKVSNQQPNLAPGFAFCSTFKLQMQSDFDEQYPKLGVIVQKQ